jgi:hypothetical protein
LPRGSGDVSFELSIPEGDARAYVLGTGLGCWTRASAHAASSTMYAHTLLALAAWLAIALGFSAWTSTATAVLGALARWTLSVVDARRAGRGRDQRVDPRRAPLRSARDRRSRTRAGRDRRADDGRNVSARACRARHRRRRPALVEGRAMKLPRMSRTALACFAVAAALLAWSARHRADDARPDSLIERLVGPIASLAANLEWVRVDDALRLGRPELAYARAEIALAIAPGDAEGWMFLAHHFAYERASIRREPDRAARSRWIDAALDLLSRGEKSARRAGPDRVQARCDLRVARVDGGRRATVARHATRSLARGARAPSIARPSRESRSRAKPRPPRARRPESH